MINKYSNVPLYSQLKDLIIQSIVKGEYAENSKIPSEQELCDKYDISRPTVRQAISELTNNGILFKEKGKGTFVARSKSTIDIKNYSGFTDSILDCQEPGKKGIISTNVVSNSSFQNIESVFNNGSIGSIKTEFVEIKYMSICNNDTMSLNTSYLPLNLFPNIIEDIRALKPSYDILKGKYPLLPVKSKSSLEIIYTDQSDAQFLQIQAGQPLIKIENILYSKSSQPVEYIISKYRADKCKLLFEHIK